MTGGSCGLLPEMWTELVVSGRIGYAMKKMPGWRASFRSLLDVSRAIGTNRPWRSGRGCRLDPT